MAQKGRRILVTYFLFSCAGLLLRKQPTSSTHPGPASSMWLSSSSNSSCSSSSCCWFPIIRPMPSSSCSCFLLLLVAILHLIASCQAADQYAYIAFANDVHNRLEEEDPTTSTPCSPKARAAGICVGGWPRISTAVKSLRLQAAREGAGFFFLDAGDEFTGTLWDAVYQGNTVAPLLLNNVKPDVMTLGNHEFDYGPQALGTFIGNLTFPMLGACNIDTSGEPALRDKLKQYIVLQYRQFKIGVVGWITPTTGETSRDVGGVKFTPIIPSVKACLELLKKDHPKLDFIVGLSHSGYEDDLVTADAVPGLDVIVGGHSHTFLYTPVTAGPIVARGPGINASNCVPKGACDLPMGPYPTYSSSRQVPVVQAYYSSKYLGLLKVNLSKRRLVPGVLPLLLGGANSSNNVQQDPELLAVLDQYRGPVDKLQTQVVGKTLVPLEGDASISRVNETNLGNYICDAFLRSVPKAVAAKAASSGTVCLMNAGGIRTGYKLTGDLTVGTVLTMLPYANTVAIFTVKGKVMIEAVRNGFSAYPTGGRFLQVAGLRVFHSAGTFKSVVLTKPDGSAVAIKPEEKYTIVATDYILQGGDGFSMFKDAEVLLPAGQPYAAQVIEDLKLFPQGIAPVTESRIIDCSQAPSFAGCKQQASTPGKSLYPRFTAEAPLRQRLRV